MIGYHYTTVKAWEKIKQTGLKPRKILEEKINGIWLWKDNVPVRVERAFVFMIMNWKRRNDVVKLKVIFEEEDIFIRENGDSTLNHEFSITHDNKRSIAPAIIITKKIEPENIKLISAMTFLKVCDLSI